MNGYIHELSDWPHFQWDTRRVAKTLTAVRYRQGQLFGYMKALGFSLRQEAVLKTLTQDVLKSSEIEGDILDAGQVRSSIARRLSVEIGALTAADRHVEGAVEVMLDATRHYDQPLTAERLLGWHASLFPAGRSGLLRIEVGSWRSDRTGPMQVVSGSLGRERVHFEAPAAVRLSQEMQLFLDWFDAPSQTDEVLKAGLAHLWFVTIHPLDDGNGRIARAIADKALARSEGSPQRFYSMSGQIRQERKAYYDVLEKTQRGSMDVTLWLEWFLACLGRAIDNAHEIFASVLEKAHFWEDTAGISFNDRQRIMVNRLLDGFEGKLTTSKWAQIAKCSQDTALRDILDLVRNGVLVHDPQGGRSTSYSLCKAAESRPAIPRLATL